MDRYNSILIVIMCHPSQSLANEYFVVICTGKEEYPRNILFILSKVSKLKILKDLLFLPVSTRGLQEESKHLCIH